MVGINLNALRQTAEQVTAANLHNSRLVNLHCGTDFNLNIFCCTLADKHIKGFADITHNSTVNSIAAAAYALADNNAAQRNYGNLTGTAADINNHAAGCFLYRQAGTDCCSHRFFNQISLTRTCFNSSINNGTLFYFRNTGRHANQNTRTYKGTVAHSLLNKILQHRLSNFIVGNNAILHRTDSDNVTGSTANHSLGLRTDCQYLVSILFNSYYRRLADNNTLILAMHQRIRSAQIYTHVIRHIVKNTDIRESKLHFRLSS